METVGGKDRSRVAETLVNWAAGKGPLHRRLSSSLRTAIQRGDIAAGTRLPAERLLARELAISRSTVVAAYAELRQEAWLTSRQGSGTFVAGASGAARPSAPPAAEPDVLQNVRRSSVFREMLEGADDTIEFLGAHLPACDALTPELLADCGPDLAAQLGSPGYLPFGLPALRRAIARHLAESGLPTSEEQVLVTNGAQQAIALVGQLYLKRGDAVVVENPTYITAIDVFGALGAQLLPVPVGPEGVRLAELRMAMSRRPRLAYLMPTFQNPTGTVLPEEARRELARLAEETGIPILEDNTLTDFSLGVESPPPIGAFTREGPVFSVGSMSKLFWGGLRVGWLRGPAPVVRRLARLRLVADLGSSIVTQIVAMKLLERAAEVKAARSVIVAENVAHLSSLLAEHLPSWSFERPAGGLSLWVRLPWGNGADFAQVALRHGVAVVPGSLTSPDGSFADHLRVPYVLSAEKMSEGVRRLARAWSAYAPSLDKRAQALEVFV